MRYDDITLSITLADDSGITISASDLPALRSQKIKLKLPKDGGGGSLAAVEMSVGELLNIVRQLTPNP